MKKNEKIILTTGNRPVFKSIKVLRRVKALPGGCNVGSEDNFAKNSTRKNHNLI